MASEQEAIAGQVNFTEDTVDLVTRALTSFPELQHLFANANEVSKAFDKLLPQSYLQGFLVIPSLLFVSFFNT